jgi:hypothetical protein
MHVDQTRRQQTAAAIDHSRRIRLRIARPACGNLAIADFDPIGNNPFRGF